MRVLVLLLVALQLACARVPEHSERVLVGRRGIWCAGDVREIRDGEGKLVPFRAVPLRSGVLALCATRAGERYECSLADGERIVAASAAKPEPIPISSVDLSDHLPFDPEVHRSHTPTTLAVSPKGDLVYLGTSEGYQLVFTLPMGEARSLPRLPFSYLRQAVFSRDGSRLYVGEQSRTGSVHAYAVAHTSISPLWTFPLFDQRREIPAEESDPVYAWAHEPGAYRLLPVDDDLVVVANQSWTSGGRFGNQARVHRIGPDGRVVWSWPASDPLPLKITWCDERARVLSFVAHFAEHDRTEAPLPPESRPGTLHVLDATTGSERASYTFEPLKPYFAHTESWRGSAVSDDGRSVAVALDDGRVLSFPLESGQLGAPRSRALTTPLNVGRTPILATAGTVARCGSSLLVATGNTYTPWILRAEDVRPAQPHPNGRTLFSFDFALNLEWLMPLENDVEGLALSDEPAAAVAVSLSRVADPAPTDVNGVSVLETAHAGGGIGKLQYTYTFGGTAPYDCVAISADGVYVAVVEMPYRAREGGTARGAARLHVIH